MLITPKKVSNPNVTLSFFTLKYQKRKQQAKLKVSRRKGTIKIRTEKKKSVYKLPKWIQRNRESRKTRTVKKFN